MRSPIPSPKSLKDLDAYDKYSAASGDDEETPVLLSHNPFKPETSSIRKPPKNMAPFSVFKEKQTLQLHRNRTTSIDHFHTSQLRS